MKKNISIYFLIFYLILSNQAIGQLNVIYKKYNYNPFDIWNIEETKDSGYIFHSLRFTPAPNDIIISKADKEGNIIWYKQVPSNSFGRFYSINYTIRNDETIILGARDKSSNQSKIYYMNQNGVIFDSIYYNFPTEFAFDRIVLSDDGNFYFLLTNYPRTKIIVAKADFNGNILWQNQINFATVGGVQNSLYIVDSKIIVTAYGKLFQLNLNGELIKNINVLSAAYRTFIKGNEIYLYGGDFKIMKIDIEGNILSENSIEAAPLLLYKLNDGGYLASFRDSSISKYDENFNFLWNRKFENSVSSFYQNRDNEVLVGMRNSLFIFKYSHNFNFLTINTSITDTLFILYDNTFLLTSNFSDSINLQYFSPEIAEWKNFEIFYYSFYERNGIYISYIITKSLTFETDKLLVKVFFKNNINDYVLKEFNIKTHDHYANIDANEVRMWVSNNGDGSHDPRTGGNGFYWPGGKNATKSAIFEEGLVFGGKVDGEIRLNGNTHRQGLKAGNILPNGEPAEYSIKHRIYKIVKNWESLPPGNERDNYEKDYKEWPVDLGAPWIDINGDGIYTPGIDKPQIIGEQTLFYVNNDLDTLRTKRTYGSPPIGLEFQVTIFAFNNDPVLKNTVFKKYKVINKSGKEITDMYFGYWTDVDLGDANDDFIGCDSTLNLGFTYNATNNDGIYGTPPPAVGHMFIQGPVVNATESDSAIFNNKFISGIKNLQISSFYPITKSVVYRDPSQGTYNGTLEFYNNLQGKIWNGQNIINPKTNVETIFPLNGDPETGTGWYEGVGWPNGPWSGDRRFVMSSGPFTMAIGDTQEVVVAIYMSLGTSNLNSVTQLKSDARYLQQFYQTEYLNIVNPVIEYPTEYKLLQNYPNPFNPETTIEFVIPAGPPQKVEIKIFDILGRELRTILNEERFAGNNKVIFNATGLSSGVYIYQIKAGSFVQTRKAVLLK